MLQYRGELDERLTAGSVETAFDPVAGGLLSLRADYRIQQPSLASSESSDAAATSPIAGYPTTAHASRDRCFANARESNHGFHRLAAVAASPGMMTGAVPERHRLGTTGRLRPSGTRASMAANSDNSRSTALIHEGWNHFKSQRPLAAWGSWQRVLRARPRFRTAAQQALAALESASDLPLAARTRIDSASRPIPRPARSGIDRMRGQCDQDLDATADLFGRLAAEDPDRFRRLV